MDWFKRPLLAFSHCGDAAGAASPQFLNSVIFQFSDFNKEPMSSLKMI